LFGFQYSVAEYVTFTPPFVEAVPTSWLYGGRVTTLADGEQVIKALSYWPRQVAKVDVWIRNKRSPGLSYDMVDLSLWETDHAVTIMDFCSEFKVSSFINTGNLFIFI
jgi:hypothetical protein